MRLPSMTFAALVLAAAAPALTEADRTYLSRDAQGAAYELAISQIAQQKSANASIRHYAAGIVADHEKYNAALRQLAGSKGVTLPTALTFEQQQKLNALQNIKGDAFDAAYRREMVRINADDQQEEGHELNATKDPDIRRFIENFRQTDQTHMDDAKRLGVATRP